MPSEPLTVAGAREALDREVDSIQRWSYGVSLDNYKAVRDALIAAVRRELAQELRATAILERDSLRKRAIEDCVTHIQQRGAHD